MRQCIKGEGSSLGVFKAMKTRVSGPWIPHFINVNDHAHTQINKPHKKVNCNILFLNLLT